MVDSQHLGPRIRRWRKAEGHTQAQVARDLGISASYLNLIEHGQRQVTVPVLLKLSEVYRVELSSLADSDTVRVLSDVREALSDALFEEEPVGDSDIEELVGRQPEVARALTRLYAGYRDLREQVGLLAHRLSDGEETWGPEATRLPSEDVTEFIERNDNYFDDLERAALDVWRDADLEQAHIFSGLIRHLERRHSVRVEVVRPQELPGAVRAYDPSRRLLRISESLPGSSRRFQLANQIALLEHSDEIGQLAQGPELSSDESLALARVALANYFAGAVMMPYGAFLDEARRLRWDVELLEHRFSAGFEQVCHRVTSLRRSGEEGVPFHFLRIDIAGNISKRFSGSGIGFARYGGACPRWNVHRSFLTPGMITTQVSRMPDGSTFFCIARTVRKAGGGFHVPQSRIAIGLGCDVKHARELVYADGINLEEEAGIVPVGVSCRLCTRLDCRQRAFPPVQHRYTIDENVRGLSFYYEPPLDAKSADGTERTKSASKKKSPKGIRRGRAG
ncbi:MAG: short-chain fatty acyl-CoA regulator family protein [Planctomycetota bacterium]